MPSRHGKTGRLAVPAERGSGSDEEQASLLGAAAVASGADGGGGGGGASNSGDATRSIYAPDEEDEPDACKVIVSLIPIVYAPSLLYSLGEAITDPVLLLYATDTLGTSVSTAAFAVSANHYGKLLSNVPAGLMYTRLGPGPSMFVAAIVYAIGTLGAIWLPTVVPSTVPPIVAFCTPLLLCGTGNAIWQIARQTYVRTLVPVAVRGRATSLMGGTGRIVSVIGPMYGGFISVYVSPEAAFYSRAATSVAAGILVLYGCIVVRRRGEDVWSPRGKGGKKGEYDGPPLSLCRVYRENWRAYATIGVVAHCLMAIRTARKAVVPLIGRSVGLGVDGIGLAMAAGATTDAALFAPTGVAFDKLGRKRVAVPALAIFTLGYVFTSLSQGTVALVAASLLVGVGNGMTAGFGQIMAADTAPDPPNTAKFLSIQSMCSDSGSLQAPIVVGALSDMFGATAGGFYCAGLGLWGLVWLAVLLREPTVGFQRFSEEEPIKLNCKSPICADMARSRSLVPPARR